MKKSSIIITILSILVLFLGWKVYGDKINPFKNTPKDAVEAMFKGAVENNFELFVKSQSQESLNRYAKNHGMTVEEVKEQTKGVLKEGYENLKKANVKFSDFKIYQPENYSSKKQVSVKVKYVGKSNYIQEDIEIPVYKASDGNWYVSQDDEMDNGIIEDDVSEKENKNSDNKKSSRISDGGPGDGVWNITPDGGAGDIVGKLTPDSGSAGDQVLKLTDEERAYLYDGNGSNSKLTAKEAKELILKEDGKYISKITNKNIKLSDYYKEYSAEDFPAKDSWNIPAETCYEFSIVTYRDDGEVDYSINEYLVGKNSGNVYIMPNQGGESAYQIKNNQKIKTFKYTGQGGSQEWR